MALSGGGAQGAQLDKAAEACLVLLKMIKVK
jgi:hypothetical protein